MRKPQPLDVVELLVPRAEYGFEGGEVGVVVRELDGPTDVFAVEFPDEDGEATVEVWLARDEFRVWVPSEAPVAQEAGA